MFLEDANFCSRLPQGSRELKPTRAELNKMQLGRLPQGSRELKLHRTFPSVRLGNCRLPQGSRELKPLTDGQAVDMYKVGSRKGAVS